MMIRQLVRIDTDTLAAREWTIATFGRVRREVSPVEPRAFDTLVSSERTA